MSRTPDRPRQDEHAHVPGEQVGTRWVTKYDPDMALKIVELIAEGRTLTDICKPGSGFVHRTTFMRWAVRNPELAKAMKVAEELSAKSFEEEALDLSREIRRKQKDGTQVRAYEVAIGQLRWSAERRDPARYGAKAPVSVRVPIQINTTLDLGTDASVVGDSKDIYTVSAVIQAPSLDEVAAQDPSDKPVVEGKPRDLRRKQVLIPPGGPRKHVPFSRMMRGTDGNQEKSPEREAGQQQGAQSGPD